MQTDSIIRDPGKFEGEPMWAPHFWELILSGAVDDTTFDGPGDCDVSWLILEPTDLVDFPELAEVYGISMWESEQGFVFSDTYATKEEYTRGCKDSEMPLAESGVVVIPRDSIHE